MNNEPVAWMLNGIVHEFDPSDWSKERYPEQSVIPLYTHPSEHDLGIAEAIGFDKGYKAATTQFNTQLHPAKTLTDEEIKEAKREALKEYYSVLSYQDEFELSWIDELFARAILRKAQEK